MQPKLAILFIFTLLPSLILAATPTFVYEFENVEKINGDLYVPESRTKDLRYYVHLKSGDQAGSIPYFEPTITPMGLLFDRYEQGVFIDNWGNLGLTNKFSILVWFYYLIEDPIPNYPRIVWELKSNQPNTEHTTMGLYVQDNSHDLRFSKNNNPIWIDVGTLDGLTLTSGWNLIGVNIEKVAGIFYASIMLRNSYVMTGDPVKSVLDEDIGTDLYFNYDKSEYRLYLAGVESQGWGTYSVSLPGYLNLVNIYKNSKVELAEFKTLTRQLQYCSGNPGCALCLTGYLSGSCETEQKEIKLLDLDFNIDSQFVLDSSGNGYNLRKLGPDQFEVNEAMRIIEQGYLIGPDDGDRLMFDKIPKFGVTFTIEAWVRYYPDATGNRIKIYAETSHDDVTQHTVFSIQNNEMGLQLASG